MESLSKEDKRWIKMMELGHRLGCHQMPERSFFFHKYQFPVCARCTGVLIGQSVAIILIVVSIKINLPLAISMLLIMGFDWFIQYIGFLESNNIRRLITGFLGGLGLIYIYWDIILLIIRLFYR